MAYYLFLCLAVVLLPGCVYLSNFDEVNFLKGLDNSRKEMQATVEKEQKLYDSLKYDLEKGRLKKQARKGRVVRLYGEPALCKPAEVQGDIKQTCIYRNPAGGIFTQLILLNFDAKDRLYSWETQEPEKGKQ